MKPFKLLLATVIMLGSYTLSAQDKIVSAPAERAKASKVEKAFVIVEKGSMISKATFRKDAKASGNVIEIEAINISGGSVSLGNAVSGGAAVRPPAKIDNIQSVVGNYLSTRDVSKSGRGVIMQLLDVNYPYRARLTVSEQVLEFEIIEPGFWKISIGLSQ